MSHDQKNTEIKTKPLTPAQIARIERETEEAERRMAADQGASGQDALGKAVRRAIQNPNGLPATVGQDILKRNPRP